jgi:hypothetical protein
MCAALESIVAKFDRQIIFLNLSAIPLFDIVNALGKTEVTVAFQFCGICGPWNEDEYLARSCCGAM